MSENEKNYLSANALSKKHNISTREIFLCLADKHLIVKEGKTWSLTDKGIAAGAKVITGKQFGEHIIWPEDIDLGITTEQLIAIPAIGNYFELDKETIVEILEKIEWLYKVPNGNLLLPKGQDAGGLEDKDPHNEQLIVRWPRSVVYNSELCSIVTSHGGKVQNNKEPENDLLSEITKEKCTAEFRTADGHFVSTEAEAIVDNFLFQHRIVHSYGIALKEQANIVSTFFIPSHNLHIDILGSSPDNKNAEKRRNHYKEKKLNYIELEEKETERISELLAHLIDDDEHDI